MEENITRDFINSIMAVRKAMKFSHCFDELSYSEMAVFGAMHVLAGDAKRAEIIKTSDICAYMKISKPALSQIINRLEDKSLIERVVQKSDRRSAFVRFTQAGEKIFERERLHMWATTELIVEKMGYEDARKFTELLNKFHTVVEEIDWEEIRQRFDRF